MRFFVNRQQAFFLCFFLSKSPWLRATRRTEGVDARLPAFCEYHF